MEKISPYLNYQQETWFQVAGEFFVWENMKFGKYTNRLYLSVALSYN